MPQIFVISQEEAMRTILTLVGQEHGLAVTAFSHPLEALQVLETSVTPTVSLLDSWREHWDDEAQALLARYITIPMAHAAILLWDAHIALPPHVRAALAAQHIMVVKKPLELALLEAALHAAIQVVSGPPDVPPIPNEGPSASFP